MKSSQRLPHIRVGHYPFDFDRIRRQTQSDILVGLYAREHRWNGAEHEEWRPIYIVISSPAVQIVTPKNPKVVTVAGNGIVEKLSSGDPTSA